MGNRIRKQIIRGLTCRFFCFSDAYREYMKILMTWRPQWERSREKEQKKILILFREYTEETCKVLF